MQVFDENNTLVAMGGTSVSTAAIAGAAAIVRQYLQQGFYPSGRRVHSDRLVPSAALMKAIIINSARSLSDDGSSKDAPCKTYVKGLLTTNCVPNYQEGFGRPNIASILPMTGRGLGTKQLCLADETNGFETSGSVHEYTFMVDMTGENPILDITLVWSDPPPLPGSETTLVNDLDLVVNNIEDVGWVNGKICDIDPFTDDYFTDPKLCQKPIPDRVNNVEKTEFDVRHYLVCTYGNGEAIEFGGCKKEAVMGALIKQEKDRRPMNVSVKVVAHRIQRPCIFYEVNQTCSIRKQPYAIAVSGPLLVQQSDGCMHPPTFKTVSFDTTTSTPPPTSPPPPPPPPTTSATITPVPLCDGATSPFILANDTLCVPNNLYPAPNVAHCVFEHTWRDLRSMQGSFSTGGLGKLVTDFEWEVWVCMDHPCATDKDDKVCFTFIEAHHVFVPWGYKSHLTF